MFSICQEVVVPVDPSLSYKEVVPVSGLNFVASKTNSIMVGERVNLASRSTMTEV